MPIDIHKEQILTLSQAARYLPKLNSKRLTPNAIWRWCRKGVGGIHLDHVRIGGRICTSPEALNRFVNELAQADLKRLNPPREEAPPSSPPISPSPRRRRAVNRITAEEAERRQRVREYLDSEGL